MPKRLLGARIVGVKGVNAVVDRRYKHHIVPAAADMNVCKDERLGVELVIHSALVKQPERARAHVGRCENCFVKIGSRALNVVVLHDHVSFSRR